MASGASGIDSLNPLNVSTSAGGGTSRASGSTVLLGGANSATGKIGIIKGLALIAGIAIIYKIFKGRG